MKTFLALSAVVLVGAVIGWLCHPSWWTPIVGGAAAAVGAVAAVVALILKAGVGVQ